MPSMRRPEVRTMGIVPSMRQTQRQARTQGLRTADTIRFGYYACKGGQLYRVMQGYKNSDDASATEYLNDIKYIAFDALRIHYDCIASCTGAPPTAWATIPSTKSSPNYGKPNPLNAVIAQAMAPNGIPQLRLEATTTNTHNTINPRTFNLINTPATNHPSIMYCS